MVKIHLIIKFILFYFYFLKLLTRVFGLIHDKNPNLMDKKSKTVQTIPEVFRSTKKTVWHNFQQTAKK